MEICYLSTRRWPLTKQLQHKCYDVGCHPLLEYRSQKWTLIKNYTGLDWSSVLTCSSQYCTARQCSPLRRKLMECSINNPALTLLMKHLVIGQRLKLLISRLFIGHHAVVWFPSVSIRTHKLLHLPKSTETNSITESDQSGPNHQLLQLCTVRTAWSD